jgi:hypothetical protein
VLHHGWIRGESEVDVPSAAGLCPCLLFVSPYLRTTRKTEVRLGREAEKIMWLLTEDPTPIWIRRESEVCAQRCGSLSVLSVYDPIFTNYAARPRCYWGGSKKKKSGCQRKTRPELDRDSACDAAMEWMCSFSFSCPDYISSTEFYPKIELFADRLVALTITQKNLIST